MAPHFPHLFVDISSHGFGHLAQTAPVLNRLAELLPALQITLRSGLPIGKLRQRIRAPFTHIAEASDFGYVMVDALNIDRSATATRYREAHAGFANRITADAALLRELKADVVFANVSYVPLAGAAQAGIPAVAMCSLNWADLFEHYFRDLDWARTIHAEMLAAYRSAAFLRTTPGMPMPALDNGVTIAPLASLGNKRHEELRQKLGAGETARIVIVALGGIPSRLPVERWPILPNTHWLVPAAWNVQRTDMHAFEPLGWQFVELLRSVDAVITKPGYGTFTEAVCNGAAVIYQRRDDWPEQDCLIEWLHTHARCAEVTATELAAGDLCPALEICLNSAVLPAPTLMAPRAFDGAETAARHLMALLA